MSVVPKPAKRLPSEEQLERERKAVELARAGVGYDEIARQVGYANRGGAWKAVQAALRRTQQGDADDLRALECDRLDRVLTGVWPRAVRGDDAAVRNVIRISQQRARLMGLNAPIKTELTIALDERQAALIVGAIQAILSELRLSPEQQVIAGEAVPRHLQALEAG